MLFKFRTTKDTNTEINQLKSALNKIQNKDLNSILNYNKLLTAVYHHPWYRNNKKINIQSIFDTLSIKPIVIVKRKLLTSQNKNNNAKNKLREVKYSEQHHYSWCVDFLKSSIGELDNVDPIQVVTKLIKLLRK